MLLFQQEGRQESHDSILRAVEQNAFCQAAIHNRTSRDFELNRLDESTSAHANSRTAFFDNFLQLLLQLGANFVDVLQQLLFFDDREEFQSHAAG